MNLPVHNFCKRICSLALLVFMAGIAGRIFAGEAIIFSGQQGKSDPTKTTPAEKGLFRKFLDKPDTDPLSGLTPSIVPSMSPLSRKQTRRMQDAADEKKNWLLLGDGELSDKDKEETSFGVHDKQYSLDGLDKEEHTRDYMFYNLAQPKKPFKPGDKKATAEIMRQMKIHDDEEASLDTSVKTEKSNLGAHTATELDLKKLFEPGQKESSISGAHSPELGLQGLFGNSGNNAPLPGRGQDDHAKFKEFLNGPAQNNDLFGPNAGKGLANDFNKAPGAGFSGFDSSPKPSSGGLGDFNPAPSANRSYNGFDPSLARGNSFPGQSSDPYYSRPIEAPRGTVVQPVQQPTRKF
ncbi:MAG TPA: hypothetical protein VGE41_04015 [Verrucomicrobiae bacterium]